MPYYQYKHVGGATVGTQTQGQEDVPFRETWKFARYCVLPLVVSICGDEFAHRNFELPFSSFLQNWHWVFTEDKNIQQMINADKCFAKKLLLMIAININILFLLINWAYIS
jgi:hypothetical protein